MKFLYLSLWLVVLCASFGVDESFAQQSIKLKPAQITDWSALFPEISGCVRFVAPLAQNGRTFEQTAVYEQQDFETNKGKNPNYFGCGSITLRYETSARKSANINYSNLVNFPMYFSPQKLKVKTFDAYRSSSWCGNDIWIGSTEVYFDKDMVLKVSANWGATEILEFAQNADYKLLKKSLDKFVKSKNLTKL